MPGSSVQRSTRPRGGPLKGWRTVPALTGWASASGCGRSAASRACCSACPAHALCRWMAWPADSRSCDAEATHCNSAHCKSAGGSGGRVARRCCRPSVRAGPPDRSKSIIIFVPYFWELCKQGRPTWCTASHGARTAPPQWPDRNLEWCWTHPGVRSGFQAAGRSLPPARKCWAGPIAGF